VVASCNHSGGNVTAAIDLGIGLVIDDLKQQ
jgi:hypothetical protein